MDSLACHTLTNCEVADTKQLAVLAHGLVWELRSEHSVVLLERAGGTTSAWGAGKASASAVPEVVGSVG